MNIEKILLFISESQIFYHNDNLSEFLKNFENDDELSDTDLDYVCAAGDSHLITFDDFEKYIHHNI